MPPYITKVNADAGALGDEIYASACVKTALAAHMADVEGFSDFGKVREAAKVLPIGSHLRQALEGPNADDNWQAHVSHLAKFADCSPAGAAAELAIGAELAYPLGAEVMDMYPSATAKRITAACAKTPAHIAGAYKRAIDEVTANML